MQTLRPDAALTGWCSFAHRAIAGDSGRALVTIGAAEADRASSGSTAKPIANTPTHNALRPFVMRFSFPSNLSSVALCAYG